MKYWRRWAVTAAGAVCLAAASAAYLAFQPAAAPMDPPIVAYAGLTYSGRTPLPAATLISGPQGMRLTPDGHIAWIPSHDDAPYAKAVFEGARGQRYELTIHVVGIPPSIQQRLKAIHEGFTGAPHSYAAFGDSITYASTTARGSQETRESTWMLNLAKQPKQAYSPPWNETSGYVFIPRGFNHASGCGWTSAVPLSSQWGDEHAEPSILKAALERDRPEAATIMFGANDANQGVPVAEYRQNLETIIDTVIAANCIPILCVPSRNGWKGADMTPYLEACRAVGAAKQVPLLDIDMLFENEGTRNMFWDEGNPHPNFQQKGARVDDYDVKTGYGVINRGLYRMYRALIDTGIIEAPRAGKSAAAEGLASRIALKLVQFA